MLKSTATDLVGIGKIWAILVEFGKPCGDFGVVNNRAMMAECGKHGRFCKEKRAVTSSWDRLFFLT